jgi:hypothetical protein
MEEEKNLEKKSEIEAMRVEMKGLIDKNISLSEDVLVLTKKINNFVVWQRIFGVVKILIFIVPLVLGLIYLPTLLENAFAPYKELLGTADSVDSNILDIGKYLK